MIVRVENISVDEEIIAVADNDLLVTVDVIMNIEYTVTLDNGYAESIILHGDIKRHREYVEKRTVSQIEKDIKKNIIHLFDETRR